MTTFPVIQKYCVDHDETDPAFANQSLCGWESLVSLSLQKNLLTSVPDVGFVQYQLIDIAVGHNHITSLSNMCHMNYTQLTLLELNDNKISHVDFSCLNMPKLKSLNLNKNLLQSIADTGMDALGEYLEPGESTIIQLSINPIHCGLNMSWIQEALHADDYIPDQYFYQRRPGTPVLHDMQLMRCHSPEQWKGHLLIDLGTYHASHKCTQFYYRKVSNIKRTKFINLDAYRLIL